MTHLPIHTSIIDRAAPIPATTADTRDALIAATAHWARLTGDPQPYGCDVDWCTRCCCVGSNISGGHLSAPWSLPAAGSDFAVDVYRAVDEPGYDPFGAVVCLTFPGKDGEELSPGQARRVAAGLIRAVSGIGVLAPDGVHRVADQTGWLSTVRCDDALIQTGAVLAKDGPKVFANLVPAPTPGRVRYLVAGDMWSRPATCDLSSSDATALAMALEVAAALADADRAAQS